MKKVESDNFGDIKPISEGIWEMREHFGSGWRMYYIHHGEVLIVMLGGGDNLHKRCILTGWDNWMGYYLLAENEETDSFLRFFYQKHGTT